MRHERKVTEKMELKINEVVIPEEITFNYEELKSELAEKVRTYEIVVYTEDQIKEAKADKANLNKLKKALNDERIRREKEYMKPFNEFKAQVNEIIGIIDRPIALIDKQLKEYEQKQKEEKAREIQEYMNTYELPYDIQIEKIFDQKWLNASVSMASIKKEIDQKVITIQADLETLENLDNYVDFAISYYRETLDLRTTLNEVKRQKEFRAMQEKVEAERLAAEEKKKGESASMKAAEEIVAVPVDGGKEIKVENPEKPVGQWINFSAFLTIAQAVELKEFFTRMGIEYKRI